MHLCVQATALVYEENSGRFKSQQCQAHPWSFVHRSSPLKKKRKIRSEGRSGGKEQVVDPFFFLFLFFLSFFFSQLETTEICIGSTKNWNFIPIKGPHHKSSTGRKLPYSFMYPKHRIRHAAVNNSQNCLLTVIAALQFILFCGSLMKMVENMNEVRTSVKK